MYYNNSDVRVEEMPRPQIGPGEILVKVMASGICGSDVMEWYRLKKAPLVLGHEITGNIVEVSGEVKEYKIGDRVFVSHHVPCNSCRYCLAGQHTACETLHTTNYFPGGFAEFIRVPALNVDRGVFILPDEISYADGTFIEPLACVVRAQRAMGFRPGASVFILGAGISGLLHLLMARACGVGRIIVSDINEYRLTMAREFGADVVLKANENLVSRVKKAGGDRLIDFVVVCTGVLSAFHQALESVDRGGALLFFAPTGPEVKLSIPVNEFWRNNIKIIHSYGAAPVDISMAVELLRCGRICVEKMITHRLGLTDIAQGFRLTASGNGSLKVIIEPQLKE